MPRKRALEYLDEIWTTSALLAGSLIISGGGFAIWAVVVPKSPGWSIGMLALAAGIMSVRPKMQALEKFAWIALLVVFAILEVRAIPRSDEENAEARSKQNASFAAIAAGLKASIDTNDDQYNSTIKHVDGVLDTTQSVAKLAQRSLTDITGGNNVVVLQVALMGNVGQPIVFSPTRGIVRDIHIRVVNLGLMAEDEKRGSAPFAHDITYDVGDLGISEARGLAPSLQLGPGDSVKFNVFFSGLSGFWNENLWLRKKNGKWFEACQVFAVYTSSDAITKPHAQRVVYRNISAGFLNADERKLNWETF